MIFWGNIEGLVYLFRLKYKMMSDRRRNYAPTHSFRGGARPVCLPENKPGARIGAPIELLGLIGVISVITQYRLVGT